MIVVGPTANFMRSGRPMRTAVLLSDLTGIVGTRELMGFAMDLELKANWMRNTSAAGEHFELLGGKIDQALRLGAMRVDRFRLARIFAEKTQYDQRRQA